jgi:hypothetical protein
MKKREEVREEVREEARDEGGRKVERGSLFLTEIQKKSFSEFLARQTPKWELKKNIHGYHAHTVGFFVSELVRRVDPRGRR